jgi:hypothetical protein
MVNIPAEVIASWPKPNLDHPVRRNGLELWIVGSIVFALGAVAVLLRTGERILVRKWFGFDDLFILFALVWIDSNRYWMQH